MINKKNYFWLICGSIIFVFLWFASSILLPFIVGLLIAYILNPSLVKLKQYGLGHKFSVSILLLMSFFFFVGIFLFLVPLFVQQFSNLIEKMPEVYDKSLNFALTYINKLIPNTFKDSSYSEILYNMLAQESAKIISTSISILQSAFKSSLAFINVLGLIVITPIVSWYILSDWDKLVQFVENLIPQSNKKQFFSIKQNSDKIISSFFRGQLTVSIILALYYFISLLLIGTEGAFIIGMSIGVLSFIPYIGSIVGLFLALSITGMQFASLNIALIVILIFIIGQLIESYYLTPKYVGKNVGLHPVIIILSLLVGGSVFGLLGIFLAIPVVAILFSFIPNSSN